MVVSYLVRARRCGPMIQNDACAAYSSLSSRRERKSGSVQLGTSNLYDNSDPTCSTEIRPNDQFIIKYTSESC